MYVSVLSLRGSDESVKPDEHGGHPLESGAKLKVARFNAQKTKTAKRVLSEASTRPDAPWKILALASFVYGPKARCVFCFWSTALWDFSRVRVHCSRQFIAAKRRFCVGGLMRARKT